MVRFQPILVLTALLVTGCAAVPEFDEVDGPAALTEVTETTPNAPASVTPDLVVEVSDLAARAAAPIICRDVLKRGSNVLVTQCMMAADWSRFERREAQEAANTVRALQGGRYR